MVKKSCWRIQCKGAISTKQTRLSRSRTARRGFDGDKHRIHDRLAGGMSRVRSCSNKAPISGSCCAWDCTSWWNWMTASPGVTKWPINPWLANTWASSWTLYGKPVCMYFNMSECRVFSIISGLWRPFRTSKRMTLVSSGLMEADIIPNPPTWKSRNKKAAISWGPPILELLIWGLNAANLPPDLFDKNHWWLASTVRPISRSVSAPEALKSWPIR